MSRKPDATGTQPSPPPPAPDPAGLMALLRDDDIDAAIDAGLMTLDVDTLQALDPASRRLLLDARARLQTAWDARERHRARAARLERRAMERAARRATPANANATIAPTRTLPPAAAAALARARRKADNP